MPVKKARTKKTARGKRPIGLTSALGPKATTMVVIVVLAGGIMVGARQQQQAAREKSRLEAARADMAIPADPGTKKKPGVTTSAAARTANVGTTASAVETPRPDTGAAASTASTPVTVVGCLERTDEGFRLKETSGAEAPKARSWKSGFLKKSSASLDVVDGPRTLQLASHVGRRVSVTGTVEDREMTARSLRTVGTCNAN
jgi:hypothetical protein